MNDPLNKQRQITNRIREIGRVMTPELIETMARLYAPLLCEGPEDGVKIIKEISYGPHERHKLDVYKPEDESSNPLPILVFYHGGGFVRGDKSEYHHIGHYFARRGILTVIPSYRLAPEYKWPSGGEDVAASIRLIREKGEEFGGDINNIFLMGHSAGAAHVSTYMFFENLHLEGGDGVAGGILMSCPTFDTDNVNERDFAYYGNDRSKHPQMSVIRNVKGCNIPVFIIFAEYEPADFHDHAIRLLNAIFKRDNTSPFFKQIMDHNHISEIMQFNTGDQSIGPDILDFIRSRRVLE